MGYLLQSGAPLYKSPVTPPPLLLVAHAICASWWRGLLNIITGAGLAYVECKTKLIRFFFFTKKPQTQGARFATSFTVLSALLPKLSFRVPGGAASATNFYFVLSPPYGKGLATFLSPRAALYPCVFRSCVIYCLLLTANAGYLFWSMAIYFFYRLPTPLHLLNLAR